MVYFAEHAALAVLEVRVHLDLPFELLPDDYVLMRASLPDEPPEMIDEIPPNPTATGDAWLAAGRTSVLSVPSILVAPARNLLLNPAHPRAAEARLVSVDTFEFDPRLWLPA